MQEGRASLGAFEVKSTNTAREGLRTRNAPVERSSRGAESASKKPLPMRPGTPAPIVTAWQSATVKAAAPYGALSVQAVSGGRVESTGNGAIVAPLTVRVTYPGADGAYTREARVSCSVSGDGNVTALV